MYNAKFVTSNGDVLALGHQNGIVFDIDGLSGFSVDLGISQGFSQIGDTVQTQSIKGQNLSVKGVIFNNINIVRNQMKRVFAPFKTGKLIFDDKYYIFVIVKDSVKFSPMKNKGEFSFRLYAPYPFFKEVAESTFYIGAITPQFRFPVNYAKPHRFGTKSLQRYINVFNSGDVKADYAIKLSTETTSSNIKITNLETLEFLKLNGVLKVGEIINIYRDDFGQLNVELIKDGETTDAISWVDDDSTLYNLEVGNNLIQATDDEGGKGLTAQITFNTVQGAIYET